MRLAFLLVAMSVSATYAATFVPNKAVGDTHDCAHYYPENSREVSEYGDVTVRYDVDATGTILNVATKVSSGSTRLDDAVVACIRDRWKDTPATLDGKPVASPNQEVTIRFQIVGSDPDSDYVAQGMAFLKHGNYFGAVLAFTRAIVRDPNAAEAYRGRAIAYDGLGRFDLASADRDKLVALRAAHPNGN